jgi:hypothetical protein
MQEMYDRAKIVPRMQNHRLEEDSDQEEAKCMATYVIGA